jgi:hypothetical protein
MPLIRGAWRFCSLVEIRQAIPNGARSMYQFADQLFDDHVKQIEREEKKRHEMKREEKKRGKEFS